MSKTVDLICTMNRECFGDDDEYNDPSVIRKYTREGNFLITKHNGKPVGYALYSQFQNHIECVRRGVLESHRGLRIGIRITKRLIARAKQLGKNYWTYAHVTNLPSINSSIRAGMTVYQLGEHWCELVYYSKKEK